MIAMRLLTILFLLLIMCLMTLPPQPVAAQEVDTPTPTPTASHTATPTATLTPIPPTRPDIFSPLGGDVVQGQVTISGTSGIPGFFSYELAFAYAGDTTNTWFLIEESFTPVQSGPLATWDTFAITDGTYDLRLRITLMDNSQMETIIQGLRVRNYSPIETSTPTNTLTFTPTPTIDRTQAFTPTETPTITPTPTETNLPPTLTPLPPNPAEIAPHQISDSLLRGAAGTLAAFILLGMYTSLRRRKK